MRSILGVSGLELHSSSTESVNFFGAQFLLAQAVIWGSTAPESLPVAPGLTLLHSAESCQKSATKESCQ